MGVRNIFLWIVIVILFAGCGTSLRSSWNNFNAYYNTFYNAKKSYRIGLEKNVSQPRDYNPLIPIRIHQKPVNAGYEDFEEAIQKSADILRKHEDSKWVDDALFLIGRSYYYQQEFYSADQKFDELYLTSDSPDLQKKAILWKSRNYLEMGLNTEGVAYISEQLSSELDNWNDNEKAELEALLAQHYVALRNWNAAEETLRESVPALNSQSLKSRGYFLLGQVYEELGIYETAYGVYDRVKDHYTNYRLQYLAQRKKAELARLMGRNDIAADIFNAMLRDDKNIDYLSELDFELARTEHERGNYERAEVIYNRVLHSNTAPVKPEIRARSYYGLAEIQRFGFDDYMMAAVYYDSAARVNVSRDLLPASFNASDLADSFGSYSRIKKELSRQDSLLQLGMLSEEELDSVVTELRRQRLLELQQQREERNREDRMMTVSQTGSAEQDATGRNGFLNTNNPALQEAVKQQFYQIWGQRPLTDNWRIQSIMRTQIVEEQEVEEAEGTDQTIFYDVEIDLTEVPFTQNEQDSVRKRISALQYELGNLMYLSMDMPDSAAFYFRKAVENPSDDRINMVSLYSLSELYENKGDAENSLFYTNRLLNEYPNSTFARELRGETREADAENEAVKLIDAFNALINDDSLTVMTKADLLKQLSLDYSEQPRSDLVLYESIQLYLEAGSADSLYSEKLIVWQDFTEDVSKDTMIMDTALADSLFMKDKERIKADSVAIQDKLWELFPYQNAAFDSARKTIELFLDTYPNSPLNKKVKTIQAEIIMPVILEKGEIEEAEETDSSTVSKSGEDEGYLDCAEINRELSFRSGEEILRSFVTDSEGLDRITLRFRVNHRGLVDSYRLLFDEMDESLKEQLDQIIYNEVTFDPTIYQTRSISVVCNSIISNDQ